MSTRRIKKELLEFFKKQSLSESELNFILGCIKSQTKYPQLTHKQWELVNTIKKRYEEK